MTPLHYAAWQGSVDCVQLLLEQRADINKADAVSASSQPTQGPRRSSACFSSRHRNCIAQTGCHERAWWQLVTPLTLNVLLFTEHNGHMRAHSTLTQLLPLLLQEGMLPIHYAAMFNRVDVAAMLLDRGSMVQPPPPKKVRQEASCSSTTQWKQSSA